MSTSLQGRTVVFLVAEDWYFWSHRLPLARAARDAGARVVVASRYSRLLEQVRAEGFLAEPIPFNRAGLNPIRDMGTLLAIMRLYRRVRPDLVHHVALKPVLFGSIVARFLGGSKVINAIAGLGFLFTNQSKPARLFGRSFLAILRMLSSTSTVHTIVQNDDDRSVFEHSGFEAERIVTIRGAGVDTNRFKPPAVSEPPQPLIAVCVSRLLWDKGIGELVEAARLLRDRAANVRIRLVGGVDANPASIPQSQIDEWAREGIVEVAGHKSDVADEYGRAHIAVLPSYREGLPKALLEAAACGLPIVSTDVPGCREICRNEVNGLTVPPRDGPAIARAIQRLCDDDELRSVLGRRGREIVLAEFSEDVVVALTLDLYQKALTGV